MPAHDAVPVGGSPSLEPHLSPVSGGEFPQARGGGAQYSRFGPPGPCPYRGAHQASGSARDGCQVFLASSVPFVCLCTLRPRCWASVLPPVYAQVSAHGNDCGCRYRSLPGRRHSAGPPVTAKGPRPAQTFIRDLIFPRILACALLPVPYWRTPRWSCWPTAATPHRPRRGADTATGPVQCRMWSGLVVPPARAQTLSLATGPPLAGGQSATGRHPPFLGCTRTQ